MLSTLLTVQGQGGGDEPPDIQMEMPWRAWEFGFRAGWAGVPRAELIAEPFKMFDNVYNVGLENNSALLITAKDVYLGYQEPAPAGPNASVQGAAFTDQFLNDMLTVARAKAGYFRANTS